MKILLFNQDWLRDEFEAMGHHVECIGVRPHMAHTIDYPGEPLESLFKKIAPDYVPDRIVVYDESSPILVGGLEETDIPVLFYSVDTHHHCEVHCHYSHVADMTLVAQRDYITHFHEVGETPVWMPLWASKHIDISLDKKYEAVFVGNLDANLNPERVSFFDRLEEIAPIMVTMGQFWNIFPHAEIVINQTVKSDLNFRVFEAMMSGAALLTEDSPNGLKELFTPDEHLVTYEKNNVEDAAQKIKELLSDKDRCREIGAAGRAEIVEKHTPRARAEEMSRILECMVKRNSYQKYFGSVANYNWATRGLVDIEVSLAAQSAAEAIRMLEKALALRENGSSELMCHAIFACFEHDRITRTDTGKTLISELHKSYPQEVLLRIAKLWCHLNRGEFDDAKEIAKEFDGIDQKQAYSHSTIVMESILSGKFMFL